MERLYARLSEFFSTPGRQAAGWAVLGILGLALALGGALLIFRDGGNGGTSPASAGIAARATAAATRGSLTPSPSPSASPSATASASPSPVGSPSPSPSPTATATPVSQQSGSTSGGSEPPPPPPASTPPPVAAGGPYCDTISPTSPPSARVAGSLRMGGTSAPSGTVVSLAFDGVLGPSRTTDKAGEYNIDFSAGGEACANRVGAVISVVVNGQSFASGHTVGDGAYLIPVLIDVP